MRNRLIDLRSSLLSAFFPLGVWFLVFVLGLSVGGGGFSPQSLCNSVNYLRWPIVTSSRFFPFFNWNDDSIMKIIHKRWRAKLLQQLQQTNNPAKLTKPSKQDFKSLVGILDSTSSSDNATLIGWIGVKKLVFISIFISPLKYVCLFVFSRVRYLYIFLHSSLVAFSSKVARLGRDLEKGKGFSCCLSQVYFN